MEREHLVTVSPAQRFSFLMLIHRTYYTPKRLFNFGWRVDAGCPRCHDTGDLIHMIWRCPKLFRYWKGILDTINKIYKTKLEMNPRLCILGLGEEISRMTSTSKAVLRCLFQARKLIAQRWQAGNPHQ